MVISLFADLLQQSLGFITLRRMIEFLRLLPLLKSEEGVQLFSEGPNNYC